MPAARGDQDLRLRYSEAPWRADGDGRHRAAHRLRQCREPDARASCVPSQGARRPREHRRRPAAPRPPTSHRELLLAWCGGALGLLVAVWSTGAILSLFGTGQNPIQLDVTLNSRVLLFTTIISVLTGVGSGLVPAIRATRVDVTSASEGVRRRSPPADGDRRPERADRCAGRALCAGRRRGGPARPKPS